MELILASSSPRRKELLELIGIKPEIVIPKVNEKRNPHESFPEFLRRITLSKAQSVFKEHYYDSVVISADTIVILNKRLIGKPANREDAFLMLKDLSDRKHEVWTGICLLFKGKTWFKVSRTNVYFDKISESEIEYYLDHENYMDKAGAYAIQGRASVFVKRIEGCYFNVMGFPLHLFKKMLQTIESDFSPN
jgi:septum formation protein